jgi:hypothetical protein
LALSYLSGRQASGEKLPVHANLSEKPRYPKQAAKRQFYLISSGLRVLLRHIHLPQEVFLSCKK